LDRSLGTRGIKTCYKDRPPNRPPNEYKASTSFNTVEYNFLERHDEEDDQKNFNFVAHN